MIYSHYSRALLYVYELNSYLATPPSWPPALHPERLWPRLGLMAERPDLVNYCQQIW